MVQERPQDASILQLIGSGPYKLIEYQKAGHFVLRANEEYWGNPKPSIAEIKIVFRNEAVVRSSMLQAGEVQLATLLTLEDAKKLPAYFIELTGEAVGLRINTEHDAAQGPAGAPGDQHVDRPQGHDGRAVSRGRRRAQRDDGPEELGWDSTRT